MTYLEAVVGPRPELELTELFVEREVSNVHFTRAEQFGWNWPEHVAEERDHCIGRHQTIRVFSGAVVMDEHAQAHTLLSAVSQISK